MTDTELLDHIIGVAGQNPTIGFLIKMATPWRASYGDTAIIQALDQAVEKYRELRKEAE